MYQYEEKVMSSWDATMMYRKGLMSEEELERIRKINKQKYAHTEKGTVAVQRATEKYKQNPENQEKMKEYQKEYQKEYRKLYWKTYYQKNRERILEQKKLSKQKAKNEILC